MTAAVAIALLAAGPAGAVPLDAVATTRIDPVLRCKLGTYRLSHDAAITVTGEQGKPRGLSYAFSNGSYGTLREIEANVFSGERVTLRLRPCADGRIEVVQNGKTEIAKRIALTSAYADFVSDGIILHGKLVKPPGGKPRALAVWVEGSNNNPSTDDTIWQFELARRGIAIFVYDKRGTGGSGGQPTSDFYARARDTAAALRTARQLMPDTRSVGVIGGSQGGWVAPLVAQLEPLDFVIPAFAMAEGPIAQDRALIELQVHQAGFGTDALTQARALTAITERIVRSNMQDGFAELEAFKAAHAAEPWVQSIQPRSYTGLFLRFSTADIKINGPALAQGLTFDFDPLPVLRKIKARQLWLLAGSDRQAPSDGTQAILRQEQHAGRNIRVVVWPTADHGLIERSRAGGQPALAAGLFDVTADWILRRPAAHNLPFTVMPPAR